MNERVQKLRQQSLEAVPSVSAERGLLMTLFYQQDHGLLSTPVFRALSFRYLLENKKIYIGDGELIVGEKGPAPKTTPTYPELCCHSLQDLDILDTRAKIPFEVSAETRKIFEDTIIPFWNRKTMRELIFQEMIPDWKEAYDAGIFTEFMEQRAPGHTVLDDKIYRRGFLDFKSDIQRSLDGLDYFYDPRAFDKQEELKGMLICADALIAYSARFAAEALRLASLEGDAQRKKELEKIADVCQHVPGHAPRDFWEALQSYWFVHLGVITELNTWDAFCPGRLDQHLDPFYRKELEDGTLDRELALELLQCFWIKFNNQLAPPKVGVTAEESGTYTDFAQINFGGMRPDGSDGVNEVTYMLLDVTEEMRLVQPSTSLQVSKKNPDAFIKRGAKVIRTGFGQPSCFNADLIVQELVRQGKSLQDARCGGSSGCVEVGAFGKENYNLTGYFNLPKVFEITLNNGVDPRSGKCIGLKTGEASDFESFDAFFKAFEKQVMHFVDIKVRGSQVVEQLYARHMPSPYLSILIDDCIARGMDYHSGGARYNTSYIQGVGIGSITDAMSALKYHVFEQKTLGMMHLLELIRTDFEGNERLRHMLLNRTPKYGNDNDYADSLMKDVFDTFYHAVEGRKNTKGGEYHINMLPTTVHVYFGSVIGATPDGRKAGAPLSEGISPVQGADRKGPTAVIRSVAKMDHVCTGGTLLNQKFTPHLLKGDIGLDLLVNVVRTAFKLDLHHIQFNVVDVETLRQAQVHPDQHRDLIVRVAGYSDYFCDLGKALQDEIIARTEHSGL